VDQFFRRWLCDNVGSDDVHLTIQFKGSYMNGTKFCEGSISVYIVCCVCLCGGVWSCGVVPKWSFFWCLNFN